MHPEKALIIESLSYIGSLYSLLRAGRSGWGSAGISGLIHKELTKETISNARNSCNKYINDAIYSHIHPVFQKIISEIEKISRVMEQDGKAQADYKEESLGDSKLILKNLADIKESYLAILSLGQLFNLIAPIKAVANTLILSPRPIFEAQICFSEIKYYIENNKKGNNALTKLDNLITLESKQISKLKKQELHTELYFTIHPVTLFNKIHRELKLACGNTTKLIIDYALDPEISFKDFCQGKLKPFLEYKITTKNLEYSYHCWDSIERDLCRILESFLKNEDLEPKRY